MEAAAAPEAPGFGADDPARRDGARPPPESEAAGDSWGARLERIVSNLHAAIETRVHLAGLEARRAIHLSLYAVALATLGALLAVTGWFALIAGAVLWAVHLGLALHWALIGVAAGSVLLAWLCVRAGVAAMTSINFDATWRTIARRGQRAQPAPSSGSSR